MSDITAVAVSIAKSTVDQSPATITLDQPAGTQPGDLMICVFEITGTRSTDITPPAGWTQITASISTSVWNVLFAYRKYAGASEPANYAWTVPRALGYVAAIHTFRNANSDGSLVINATGIDLVTAFPPTLTTTIDRCMILAFGAPDWPETCHFSNFGSGWLYFCTERWSQTSNDNCGAGGDFIVPTAGESGLQPFTLGPPGAVGGVAIQIAIRPADPAPPPPPPITTLQVTPVEPVTLRDRETQQYAANLTVNWSVIGRGTVSAFGLYKAPNKIKGAQQAIVRSKTPDLTQSVDRIVNLLPRRG